MHLKNWQERLLYDKFTFRACVVMWNEVGRGGGKKLALIITYNLCVEEPWIRSSELFQIWRKFPSELLRRCFAEKCLTGQSLSSHGQTHV